ncbi:hypothetical protein MLD38_012166 [Melastoma candidum]|uniref:Uncharacterized protein n=1 Tax=Melastoma candidum TaxID=119954 RepID=A0ACB9R9L7_9MYRT|nr:hypothetical protein MLD38_012166 [Melastoma candidum]
MVGGGGGGSDGEIGGGSPAKMSKDSVEGQGRPKRKMKTPFQLETLEKAYATEAYPSEAMRTDLSKKLGLLDRQLQMWFCHRRLKDKKNTVALLDFAKESVATANEHGSDNESGSGSGSSPNGRREFEGANLMQEGDEPGTGRRYHESPRTIMELRAIACVESQLGELLREDGPILGMEFDPLPPDAFGTPIMAMEEHQLSTHSYDGKLCDGKVYARRDSMSNKADERSYGRYQYFQEASRYSSPGQAPQSHCRDAAVDGPTSRRPHADHENEKLSDHRVQGHPSRGCSISQEDKAVAISSPSQDDHPRRQRGSSGDIRMNDDGLGAREVEAHENRARKTLEKETVLRRKKEMERYDRERRKEEERLMREKQREEEKLLREQKREMERHEKLLQGETIKAEKRKQKEELRREREEERRKAAMEKATARRIAKESMELMEDEQLELMELASSNRGLSSMIQLDHATLQNLDLFKDSLSVFPGPTVQLKKPFCVHPWINSEENIGNLLMAWRFLITFADVLGLWPFTIDEFVQAFHDYDSRLLGEVHIALLQSIVKDIEDVNRTPASSSGMNQNSVANPDGGGPQIVQGAFAWGFDICKWQKHLNPVTWPEIFRQLALSAGFGPQLKKKCIEEPTMKGKDEVKDCKYVIDTLRSGSAAAKALSIMRERGLLAPRKSRHRLTPGTVKFAAFHVLSLEGGKGLNVIQLADKIQKSGLRDLSTSKSPEASISVALTRDVKLFERIAPSTYRVRGSYRKDPADAESILSEARKKIKMFENGILEGEDGDGGEVTEEMEREDDGARDEESEGDIDEDLQVDDMATISNSNNDVGHFVQSNFILEPEKEFSPNHIQNLQNENEENLTASCLHDFNYPKAAAEQVAVCDDGDEIEESTGTGETRSGESWVYGLTEGDYAHLSVQERLTALVALIGIANEGNSIRSVLEDRLEVASTLKKQMLVEAQLDKSRVKEEFLSKVDASSSMESRGKAIEGLQIRGQILAENGDNKCNLSTADDGKLLMGLQVGCNEVNNKRNGNGMHSATQDLLYGPDSLSMQNGIISKRSRFHLKSYISQRAEEIYAYRSLPLGEDRRRNRYWQFIASASKNDPASGRIFVELVDGSWKLIDTIEAFDALLMSLDVRGLRESHLRIMLLKVQGIFKESVRKNFQHANAYPVDLSVKRELGKMDTSPEYCNSFGSPCSAIYTSTSDTLHMPSSLRIQLGRNAWEKKAASKRYREFEKWIWKECCNSFPLCAKKIGMPRCQQLLAICETCLGTYFHSNAHCGSCHQTFQTDGELSNHIIKCEDKSKLNHERLQTVDSSFPFGIRLVKWLLATMEAFIPPEALRSFWNDDRRNSWGMSLMAALSPEQLLQCLTSLEGVVRPNFLSDEFETTRVLLGLVKGSVDEDGSNDSVPMLPWIPRTIAAVALRLFELDSSIGYMMQEKSEPCDDKTIKDYIKVLPRHASRKLEEEELWERDQDVQLKEPSVELRKSHSNGKKRRFSGGDRSNGSKFQKQNSGPKSCSSRRKIGRYIDNSDQGRKLQQGQRKMPGGASFVRGRRTLRKRMVENRSVEEKLPSHLHETKRPRTSLTRGWNRNPQKRPLHMETAENSNSEEGAAESDNNGVKEYENGREHWDDEEADTAGAYNGWAKDSPATSEEDGVDSSDNGIATNGMEDMLNPNKM